MKKLAKRGRFYKETMEIAMEEFVRSEKSKKLVELKGKVEISFSLYESRNYSAYFQHNHP